jgi:DNA-binding GntR family transcriptional regulator
VDVVGARVCSPRQVLSTLCQDIPTSLQAVRDRLRCACHCDAREEDVLPSSDEAPPIRPTIRIDRSSPVPLYHQVAEQLEAAITSGELAPGDRITNEVALATQLGLSRPTMRQAIQLLVDQGRLVRKRGVGTQVVQGQIRRPVELTSLHDDLRRAGQDPHTAVLHCRQVTADDDVANELQLPAGAPVWDLLRVRMVGDEPLAVLHNFVPVEAIDLAAVDLAVTGLYDALRAEGVHLRVAHQRIGARRADAREAKLLGEHRGAPLLTMSRTAYDDAGRAVELGNHVYRADRQTFEVTLVDR